MSTHRPTNVTAIAVALANLVEILIIGAVINEIIISGAYLEEVYSPILIDQLLGLIYSQISINHFNNMHLTNISILILSALLITTIIASLRTKKWGHHLIQASIIIMIGYLILLTTGILYDTPYTQLAPGREYTTILIISFYILPIILAAPITIYLLRNTKKEYEKNPQPP